MHRKNSMGWWLHRNIKNGDLEQVKKLAAKHPDAAYLNAKDKNGNTALLLAVKHERYDIALHLLSIQSVDINAVNTKNENIINLLFDRDGKNVDVRHNILKHVLADQRLNLDRHPSLQLALRWCTSYLFNDTARDLIEKHHVNVNCGALAIAAKKGNMEMVIRLLACPDIDVMQQHKYQEDALNEALYIYDQDHSKETGNKIFRLLLDDPRTDVNKTYKRQISYDGYQVALIEMAARSDPYDENESSKNTLAVLAHPKTEQSWIKKMNHPVLTWAKSTLTPDLFRDLPGINIKQDNVWSYSYSGWKVNVNKRRLLNFLVNDKRFNINTQLWNGSTALIQAVKDKDEKLVDLVLQYKECDIHAQDKSGRTALIAANETGNAELENKLIDGITFEQTYSNNRNIVMLAAAFGRGELVDRLLLLAPPDFNINAQDANGNTILTLAAIYDDAKLAGTLLDAGADAYIKNRAGRDAIMIANDNKYFGLATLMSRTEPKPAPTPAASAPPASAVGLFSPLSSRLIPSTEIQEYTQPPKLT